MPPIRSTASKRYTLLILIIILLGIIIPFYFYYIKKKLLYIIITALSGYHPFFYFKYTKLNMRLSYHIQLISNTKCTFLTRFYT